jgi:hypothetical protein
MADEQDNPGSWVPPPLTYLLTLLLGLLLEPAQDSNDPHGALLPRAPRYFQR